MGYNRRSDLLVRRGVIERPRVVRCSFCLEKLHRGEKHRYKTWTLCSECFREARENGTSGGVPKLKVEEGSNAGPQSPQAY